MIEILGWQEAINKVKRAIEYGVNCNDLTLGELAEEIEFAFDDIARKNGLPEIDWEYHEPEATT